jgi:hypothetical protein
MTTISKNIEIPENRRLQLDLELPNDIPIGTARNSPINYYPSGDS